MKPSGFFMWHHLLWPFKASAVKVALDNHSQPTHIDGAFDNDEQNGSHHDHGLDHICPDNGLQTAGSGVKNADEADNRGNNMNVYASN